MVFFAPPATRRGRKSGEDARRGEAEQYIAALSARLPVGRSQSACERNPYALNKVSAHAAWSHTGPKLRDAAAQGPRVKRTRRSCSVNGSLLRASGVRSTVQQHTSATRMVQPRYMRPTQTAGASHRHVRMAGVAPKPHTKAGRSTLTSTKSPRPSAVGNMIITLTACRSHETCPSPRHTAIMGACPRPRDPARRVAVPRTCLAFRTSTEACHQTSASGKWRSRPPMQRSSPHRSVTR